MGKATQTKVNNIYYKTNNNSAIINRPIPAISTSVVVLMAPPQNKLAVIFREDRSNYRRGWPILLGWVNSTSGCPNANLSLRNNCVLLNITTNISKCLSIAANVRLCCSN